MPRDDAAASVWFVKVDGRVYGPYTAAQMRAFVGEGRVAAHSLVATEREGEWRPAGDVTSLRLWLDEARGHRPATEAGGRLVNLLVAAEIHGGDARGFEAALAHFGEVERIVPNVWLLRGQATAATLRNELSHLLDREDRLLVVDASRDRSAWFNLGREADQRLRDMWGSAPGA